MKIILGLSAIVLLGVGGLIGAYFTEQHYQKAAVANHCGIYDNKTYDFMWVEDPIGRAINREQLR